MSVSFSAGSPEPWSVLVQMTAALSGTARFISSSEPLLFKNNAVVSLKQNIDLSLYMMTAAVCLHWQICRSFPFGNEKEIVSQETDDLVRPYSILYIRPLAFYFRDKSSEGIRLNLICHSFTVTL
jgi:hypothetical protein